MVAYMYVCLSTLESDTIQFPKDYKFPLIEVTLTFVYTAVTTSSLLAT